MYVWGGKTALLDRVNTKSGYVWASQSSRQLENEDNPSWRLLRHEGGRIFHSWSPWGPTWAGYFAETSAQVLWPSVSCFTTDATSLMSTRICSLLSLSRIVTFVAESTVTANGTPISSVLAYLLPIEIAARKQTQAYAYYSPFSLHYMEWSIYDCIARTSSVNNVGDTSSC